MNNYNNGNHYKKNKRNIGSYYEKIACEELKKQGYNILETNYYTRIGEIDIVAKDGDYLVFIEVKYRRSHVSGLPEEAVDARKRHRIYEAARYYMLSNRIYTDTPMRFDVVAIEGDEPKRDGSNHTVAVRIIKNAFML